MAIFGSSVGGAGIGGGITLYVMTANEQPITARDNTIWIQTDTVFSGKFVIDNTEPSSPAVGDVWIQVSTVGVSLNVAKDINICPNNVKIYENGVWSSHPTKAYVSGTWRDIVLYVVMDNQLVGSASLIGGHASQTGSYQADTISANENGVGISTNASLYNAFTGWYGEVGQFTNCEMHFYANLVTSSATRNYAGVFSSNPIGTNPATLLASAVNSVPFSETGTVDRTISFTLGNATGYKYVGFNTYHGTGSAVKQNRIKALRLY